MNFKEKIRIIPNFPYKGILFKDITPILQDGILFNNLIDIISEKIQHINFDVIISPESRGFILGAPVAYKLKKSFIPVRKKGKLPYETIKKEYTLEYGKNVIEIHKDALSKGDKVVIIDDILATGGTCKAICNLVEELNAKVESIIFFIELEELKGRDILSKYNIKSIVRY